MKADRHLVLMNLQKVYEGLDELMKLIELEYDFDTDEYGANISLEEEFGIENERELYSEIDGLVVDLEQFFWEREYLMDNVKSKLIKMEKAGYLIQEKLACIHDLFHNYLIDEEQEEELYKFVDPDNDFNNVHSYWENYIGENPLMDLFT